MKSFIRLLTLVLAFSLTGEIASAAEREKGLFEFRDGDRVVLLGGTFIERMQNDGYFETMVTASYPHGNITFRNLGWSGDTVWGDSRAVFGTRADGFKRLVADVKLCQPTVIIVCYGENEAFAGPDGLGDFRAGLNTLLDALEATGARIVLLGPHPHINIGPPLPDPTQHNEHLRQYIEVTKQAAMDRKHWFFDLYSNLEKPIKQAEADPRIGAHANFAKKAVFTENGIHLHDHGNVAVGRFLLSWLAASPTHWEVHIDLESGTPNATGATVTEVAVSEKGVSFTAVDRELADIFSAGAGTATIWLQGLGPGTYQAFANGKLLGDEDGMRRLEGPVEKIGFYRETAVARMEQLRQTIIEKNQLFFHRYRPQNETYLFLFRKHEQGNNAVEIPQFDPLIAEKEAKIAEIRKPLKQKFEIIKVK